jgi:hypothetical protein
MLQIIKWSLFCLPPCERFPATALRILLIKLGPVRCLMPIGMEHGGECSHGRSTKEVNDTICAPCLILDVEMELLQVCGPFFMAVILQLPLFLYELQMLVISVDDCLIS